MKIKEKALDQPRKLRQDFFYIITFDNEKG